MPWIKWDFTRSQTLRALSFCIGRVSTPSVNPLVCCYFDVSFYFHPSSLDWQMFFSELPVDRFAHFQVGLLAFCRSVQLPHVSHCGLCMFQRCCCFHLRAGLHPRYLAYQGCKFVARSVLRHLSCKQIERLVKQSRGLQLENVSSNKCIAGIPQRLLDSEVSASGLRP